MVIGLVLCVLIGWMCRRARNVKSQPFLGWTSQKIRKRINRRGRLAAAIVEIEADAYEALNKGEGGSPEASALQGPM